MPALNQRLLNKTGHARYVRGARVITVTDHIVVNPAWEWVRYSILGLYGNYTHRYKYLGSLKRKLVEHMVDVEQGWESVPSVE
jgi:hypothetical protein